MCVCVCVCVCALQSGDAHENKEVERRKASEGNGVPRHGMFKLKAIIIIIIIITDAWQHIIHVVRRVAPHELEPAACSLDRLSNLLLISCRCKVVLVLRNDDGAGSPPRRGRENGEDGCRSTTGDEEPGARVVESDGQFGDALDQKARLQVLGGLGAGGSGFERWSWQEEAVWL
jgi:hypothetical protein